MNMTGYARSMVIVALLAVAGGCTTVNRVDMAPAVLRDELRAGEVVKAGDRVTVVSEVQGDLTFVVTEVDAESIRGESVDVPIDEVVALEKRSFAPLRTGAAIYGGTYLVGMTIISTAWILAILF